MRRFIKILLIEDNVDDVFFFRLGIGQDEVTLIPVSNAEAAIKHLRSNPLPDLVVTDLKLPGMSINDFLDWVRKDPHVQKIPIVIYTGSPTVSGQLKGAVKETFFKACSLAKNQATVRKMITLAKSKTGSTFPPSKRRFSRSSAQLNPVAAFRSIVFAPS